MYVNIIIYSNKLLLLVWSMLKKEKKKEKKEEAVIQRCSVKKVFLEISQNSQENTCARVFFFIKKETLAQVFSCEFCEISKNTFYYRTPLLVASRHVPGTPKTE